jgi:hypothetical protein
MYSKFIIKNCRISFFSQLSVISKKFEDIKGVIRNRKSRKDSQYNGQKKKNKQSSTLEIKVVAWYRQQMLNWLMGFQSLPS